MKSTFTCDVQRSCTGSTSLNHPLVELLLFSFLNILICCLSVQRKTFMHLFFRFSTSFSPSDVSNQSVLSVSFLRNKKKKKKTSRNVCMCAAPVSVSLCLYTLCRNNSPCNLQPIVCMGMCDVITHLSVWRKGVWCAYMCCESHSLQRTLFKDRTGQDVLCAEIPWDQLNSLSLSLSLLPQNVLDSMV